MAQVMRVFCDDGRYKYHTAIGDFDVAGSTGRWRVFRGGVMLADLELLGEVDLLINVVVAKALAEELKRAE